MADHLWPLFRVPVERRRSDAGGLRDKEKAPPFPHRHSVADKLTLGLTELFTAARERVLGWRGDSLYDSGLID